MSTCRTASECACSLPCMPCMHLFPLSWWRWSFYWEANFSRDFHFLRWRQFWMEMIVMGTTSKTPKIIAHSGQISLTLRSLFQCLHKSLHKDWSWHARRSGRPIRGVCRNCRLTLRSPWQLGLHDLPRQLCNYLGGKFSSRAACPLFPTNSASLGRNLGKRPHKKIFKILDNLKSDLFQARIMGISWEVESIIFAVVIA